MIAGVLLFFGLKRLSDFGFDANLLDGNDISHKCYIWSFALYRSLTKWTPTWNIKSKDVLFRNASLGGFSNAAKWMN